jgi:DnaJ domain
VPRDLYAALGRPRLAEEVRRDGRGPDVPLPRSATQAEVDEAFVAAVRRHHPDHNPSDQGDCAPGTASARFRDAMCAGDVLRDPGRRADYDAGLWVDPLDPVVGEAAQGEPGWHRAVTDPRKRKVLGGAIQAACVLGGLDEDAAALASDVAIGAAVGAVEIAGSPGQVADRSLAALGAAARKVSTPEGRAELREAGASVAAAWRRLFD